MAPAVIAASAVQVNVMINGRFASELPGDGPVSWLSYAFRLMQLPLGIFGVAIGTVTLPLVSRSAASGDTAGLSLHARARDAARLSADHSLDHRADHAGAPDHLAHLRARALHTRWSTAQTAAALQFYALGLVAYSGIKVLAPAFYALDKRKTPMMVSFASIGTNLLLNWLFTFHMGSAIAGWRFPPAAWRC